MRIATFNVNGIRSRVHQIAQFVRDYRPDVLALQEIKCVDDVFPYKAINELGYHAEVFGQKGHYGVATLSKRRPVDIELGFKGDDDQSQRRMIKTSFIDRDNQKITIYNCYFPQGESRVHPTKFPAKKKFYADLLNSIKTEFTPKDNVMIVGDYNVAPEDIDVGISEESAARWLKTGKCAFLPEEREWLNNLINWGMHDIFREMHPNQQRQLSWFDYRSAGFDDDPKRGLRIDLILATEPIKNKCTEAEIAIDIRAMYKPSDHAPVWISLK